MILPKLDLKSRRGQALAEQAFLLAAIAGIVLVVIARMGFETSSVFAQLGKTFPRSSKSGPGKQPAAQRGKRLPTPTAMAGANRTPATAAAKAGGKTAAKKLSGARARRRSGGAGLPAAKRARAAKPSGSVSWAVTSASPSSGSLSVLFGSR